jgi:hypothetical protein
VLLTDHVMPCSLAQASTVPMRCPRAQSQFAVACLTMPSCVTSAALSRLPVIV